MKDNTQEMLRRARELMGSGQVFQPMGMEVAKAKIEQHLNGGISNARDRLRESAQCEQTVLALNDLLNETQKKAMLLVDDNARLRAELAELRKQPAAVPLLVNEISDICNAYESGVGHRGRPTGKVNPYPVGSHEHEAYAIGAAMNNVFGTKPAQPAPETACDARDAERYRYIRDNAKEGAVKTLLPLYRAHYFVSLEPVSERPTFDAAIDAAILAKGDAA